MLCIPTVTVEEVAVFARLCLETAEYADLPEGERDICLAALSAATGFVKTILASSSMRQRREKKLPNTTWPKSWATP